jgi:restriction system protein
MYGAEIEELLGHGPRSNGTRSDPEIEDEASFRMEKHLESFLVENWSQTELGKNYEILEEDGELVGQQYQTDTGPIDLLAISKDRKKLLVVELKKGRVSDAVVGQIARYMGYVKEELAEDYQSVEGVIIGLDDDQRVKRALSVFPNVRFYRYQISFKLLPAES